MRKEIPSWLARLAAALEAGGCRREAFQPGWAGALAASAGFALGAGLRGAAGLLARPDAAALAGGLLCLAGSLLGLAQRTLRLEAPWRALSPDERAALGELFGGSLALERIRLVLGRAGVYALFGARPFALGWVIYLKQVDPAARMDVLAHECVHCWQYQRSGPRYAAEALWAQARLGSARQGGAYDWAAEAGRGRKRWVEYNPEAQAQLAQELFSGLADADLPQAREAAECLRMPYNEGAG